MISFDIEFVANGTNYKARAQRIPAVDNLPVEYQVLNFDPEIPKAPKTFMFIYNPARQQFESTVFNGDVALSKSMFDAVKKYLGEQNIPLSA